MTVSLVNLSPLPIGNPISWHIARNERTRTDDCAIPNDDLADDQSVGPDEDIVAEDRSSVRVAANSHARMNPAT
nr:hypothetical protein [Microbacterium sp. BH-3-3-3]